MKRLATILLGIMLTSCSLGYYSNDGMGLATTANISLQPAWGPAGYDCAHYYYFPDFNFYYDVDNALFYYLSGSRWISARELPYSLGYPRDLYKFYKVVLNIRNPWNHNRAHRREYKHFRGVHTQPVLRDTRPNHKPQPAYRPSQGNRPPQNGYQSQQRPPQDKPQQGNGNGYGNDNRNTIRGSRNNNTSRNTVAPDKPNNGTGNKVQQTPQRPKSQGQSQSSRTNVKSNNSNKGKPSVSGSRGNGNKSRPSVSSSRSSSQSKSNTRSSSSSNSSSNGRSTGSRGR